MKMSTFFISPEVFTRSNNLLRSRSFDVSRWLLKPILLKASLSHSKTRVNFNSNCSCCSLQYFCDSDSSAVAVISSEVSVSAATFVFFRDLPNSEETNPFDLIWDFLVNAVFLLFLPSELK